MPADDGSHGFRPWLLIDASQEGLLRFATARPSANPRLDNIRDMEIAGLPTFTDALQRYGREAQVELRGMDCAMAIAGAATGETISLVRSRWTIARSGMAAIFGGPVTIINDVVARAWGTRSNSAIVDRIRGIGTPNLQRPGRYVMIIVEEGVGAAAIDVASDLSVRILETEAGHMDFAPSSDAERNLAEAMRGLAPATSWEKMLMLDRADPAWAQACPGMTEPQRLQLLAGMLGRFSVNVMHAFGAWQGIMLTGSRAARIVGPGSRPAFDAAFLTRRHFSRLVTTAPAWHINQREAVLSGTAEYLAQQYSVALKVAA